jgi:hypothetical protein
MIIDKTYLIIGAVDDKGVTKLGSGIRNLLPPWEEKMKIRKTVRGQLTERGPHDLATRQQAILAAAGEDARSGFWALELLKRRDAVARWRGQPGCTIREVIQAINGLPA